MRKLVPLLAALIALSGCSGQPQSADLTARPSAGPASASIPTPAATEAPPATPVPTATPAPTATPEPTATPAPSATPEPTATPAPTTTPDPVAGLTIPDLRAVAYGEGEISIGDVYIEGPNYTTYRISYPAGGLRLTGLIHIPDGPGPFIPIIANRGTIARDIYRPGMDSRAFADYMVRRGYLIVAPDFRGYAGGDDGPNPFYTGFYQDVLHLIPQVQRLPMARPGPVGMWGHSRGASVTIAALTVTDQIAAAVAYAPAPADLAEDYWRRFRNSGGNPGSDTWVFTPDANPDAYRRISPISYFDAVGAPVMLHHGTADTTVDDSASVAIADALRAAGKEVTLHLYEGGPHTLQGAQEALYLERTLTFFQQHLGAP
jgi:dienelactone hydrolase